VLTIYRRHLATCEHADKGRSYRRCKCPLWVQGTLSGQPIRKALDLTAWEAASDLVRDWEARGTFSGKIVPVVEAVADFMRDAKARHLTAASLAKMGLLFERQLVFWAEQNGIKYVSQLDVATLREFRGSWADGAISATKKLERLRSFFRFAKDSGWIDENPAKLIRSPKVTAKPTLPFTEDEVKRILAACDKYPRKNSLGQDNRARIRAFVLLLRYSGLRLQDAVTLEASRLKDGKLFLYTQKTGTPVYLPLPPFVAEALTGIRKASDDRFFWSGVGHPRSCMSVWDRSLRRVFKLASVENGHAHRFRDTFAVSLLERGVPIEDVSILLGHSNVQVTQRHYSPWVRSRQQRLEERVKLTWGEDTQPNTSKSAPASTKKRRARS
jgi:integrase/recombinase XerD